MSFLPSLLSTDCHSFLRNPSESSMYVQKQKLKTEQKKAHRTRVLEEIKRPKLVLLDKSLDKVLPSSFYIERARQTYLQKSFLSIDCSPAPIFRQMSEKKLPQNSKLPALDRSHTKSPDTVYPDWLLNKPDFLALVAEDESSCSAIEKIVQAPVAIRSEKQNEALLSWLNSVKYFQSLPRILASDVSKKLVYKEYSTGSVLMNIGEIPDYLFVVYTGLIGVYIDSKLIASCGPRNTVGEVAFDSAMNRTATCIAEEPTQTFILDRKSYKDILENVKKLEKFEYNSLLMSMKYFEEWTLFKIQALSACLIPKTYKKGEVIYEKGTDPMLFLILKSGKVNLQTFVNIEEQNRWPDGNHKWKIRKINKQFIADVGYIYPPCYFGETDLINDRPREYRAVAVKKCECAVLNKREFFGIFNARDIQRMKETNHAEYPSPTILHERILGKLNSKKSKRKAIIDAMEIDINTVGGRELPFIRQKLKIKNWIEAFRGNKNNKIR